MAIKLNGNLPLKQPEFAFLAFFLVVRIFSFLTFNYQTLNQTIAFLIVILFFCICLKNLSQAWLTLIAELMLDGAGHFFELEHLILRTWFLGIFACFWLFKKIKERNLSVSLPRPLIINLIIFAVAICWSILQGFIQGHDALFILQDAVLYFFILLFLPGSEFREHFGNYLVSIIKIFIIGSAIFSLATFFIYASGIGVLQDAYYHWFRDVAAGKITDLGNNFFRIVLPEQLFIIPIILILASKLINEHKNKFLWLLLVLLLLILTLNFSRIYFLALAFGMAALIYKNSFKQWLKVSAVVFLSTVAIFVSLVFFASGGSSFGLEMLGMKISGAAAPRTDLSGAIRMAMLPDIFNTIKKNPFLGTGLGATVSYIDPLTKEMAVRTQFDWGYLEMFAELGIIGSLLFFSFLFLLLYYLSKIADFSFENNNRPLLQGLMAGALSLFVINLTTPALFQGFGIIYFAFLMIIINSFYEKNPTLLSDSARCFFKR